VSEEIGAFYIQAMRQQQFGIEAGRVDARAL
jgi:hypothetical protein